MKILRLMLSIGPTSAPYNEHTVPTLDLYDNTICTYFPSEWPADERLDYHEGAGGLAVFACRLWQMLRQQRFDIVDLHSPHLGVIFLAVALVARPSLLRRSVLHVHSSYQVYRLRNRCMLLPCFAVFSRIVCCSRSSLSSFPRLFRILAGSRLMAVCNGVDLRRVDRLFCHRGTEQSHFGFNVGQREEREFQLATIGNLRALKNHATVLRALAKVRSRRVRLTVIGGGPLLEPLSQLAAQLGIAGQVRFTGCVSREQTLRALWESDGFVSMSRGEGLPVAVLEAMSCYCPVILSDIPPHGEIRGARTDLFRLLNCDDVAGLSQEITRWLAMPTDVLRYWGADCRHHVEERYSLDQMLDEMYELFRDLGHRSSPEWDVFRRCMAAKREPRRVA